MGILQNLCPLFKHSQTFLSLDICVIYKFGWKPSHAEPVFRWIDRQIIKTPGGYIHDTWMRTKLKKIVFEDIHKLVWIYCCRYIGTKCNWHGAHLFWVNLTNDKHSFLFQSSQRYLSVIVVSLNYKAVLLMLCRCADGAHETAAKQTEVSWSEKTNLRRRNSV